VKGSTSRLFDVWVGQPSDTLRPGLIFATEPSATPIGLLPNQLMLIVPIAGNLFAPGLPTLFSRFVSMVPKIFTASTAGMSKFGRTIPDFAGGVLACVVSGVIGNLAYDLIKRRIGPLG